MLGDFCLFHTVSFGQLKTTEFILTVVPGTANLDSYFIVISDFIFLKKSLVIILVIFLVPVTQIPDMKLVKERREEFMLAYSLRGYSPM